MPGGAPSPETGSMKEFLDSLAMGGLAVLSVGLWTVRVALTARGRKVAGSLTAAAEALVFLLAFSSVLANIDAVGRIAGYAGGVGLGTMLGLLVDERLSTGQSEVRVVTEGSDKTLVYGLHASGWPVTWSTGSGPFGEVTVAFVAVDDTRLRALLGEIERLCPGAFWTVETLRRARSVPLGNDWIQVGHGFHLVRHNSDAFAHERRRDLSESHA